MNTNPNERQPDKSKAHLDTTWSPVADAMRHDLHQLTTKQGNPIDPADPGTPTSRALALLSCVMVVAMVLLWTNTSDAFKDKIFNTQPAPAITQSSDHPAPGNFGEIDIPARIALRGLTVFKPYLSMPMLVKDETRLIDEDKVRLIMLAGELEGTESALERIEALKVDRIERADPQADPNEANDLVTSDLNILEAMYIFGIDALEDNERDQIAARYGLVGQVALTHELDDADPRRAPLIDGAWAIILFMSIAGLVLLIVPLTGFCLLVFGIVWISSGKIRLRNHVPAKGGSIFLETYVVFVGSFLVMLVAAHIFPQIAPYTLILQWLMLVTIFWGIFRGMKRKDWKQAIGWHKGEGVFKEIGCGILAYIASVPLFLAGTLITMVLLILKGIVQTLLNNGVAPKSEPMTNPIVEIIASGDVFTVILLFLLAVTWAPIVEETIFRGALFRHLRSSMHWVFAALLSAVLFAFMHSYGPLMVSPLIALGFMFAFMREWRGSLIAAMTAHFLHNFLIIGATVLFVFLLNGPT